MSATAIARPQVSLEDRYAAESGPLLINGIQALVRLMLDLRRLDARRGLNTGVFVSGYQGSPLGGLDRELQRARRHLDPAGVVFQPGINEELAATAVGGTQLLGELRGRRKDGVTGFWYGKSPGFDRAADAIRHSTLSGTAPLGGAVALIGDDPASKSSTVPSSCEPMCRSLAMPLLAPGTVAEVISFGLHAVALSRYGGMWSGMKIVADVADASATIDAGAALEEIPLIEAREAARPPVLLPPSNLDAEHDLFTARLERVHEYARLADLNRIVFEPTRPRFALMAAGVGFQATLRALADLGLDELGCEAAGIRLVQLSMPWPLEARRLRELARDVQTVVVVEDKLPFIESQLKEALYGHTHQPRVLGKEDQTGQPLLPVRSAVGSDEIADALVRILPAEDLPERALMLVAQRRDRVSGSSALTTTSRRIPTFCSGCPHNLSTRAGADQLVGVGIGCHIMVALEEGQRRGHLLGMPQMGGEGAQWFGLAPFTSEPHFIQNLGDGTFHHSGSLVIRAAVAAKVNITYRLLYNDAVAMTGGQEPIGNLPIPDLVRELAIEGVKRVIITTPEPERYRGVALDPIAEVRHRDELEPAQQELAALSGVTVLLHDDRCATEKRRLRKRGTLETPAERVWINERVCEGCGDCGEKSSCVSVQPVSTPFGRKTRIHQSSCNLDTSCVKGDCPSFLLVTPRADRPQPARMAPPACPDPDQPAGDDVLIRMPGVGGTGVVTISAILQMAAHLEGRHAAALEQTGLAQKGGPVISDLRIAAAPVAGQIRATSRSADVLLGFDLLGAAAAETLAVLDPQRSVAVVNTGVMPTAAMVTDPTVPPPATAQLLDRIRRASCAESLIAIDAEAISERLFGDHMPANMVLVGAAYQNGCLPLTAEAIERAIDLNGAAAETNRLAFGWGRAAVADPTALEEAMTRTAPAAALPAPIPRDRALIAAANVPESVRQELEVFVPELAAYQNAAYARRYVADVERVAALEHLRTLDDRAAVAVAYARGLFKLMAYKDEYEVARLHLDAVERSKVAAEFGPGAKVQVLLHPPLLRALGVKRKLRFGRSARSLFVLLRVARRLRGTPLDPFGYATVRRAERQLIPEYRTLVERGLKRLDPQSAETVAELAALPDLVRGYEDIKLANVQRMRRRASEILDGLEGTSAAERSATEDRPMAVARLAGN